MRVLLQNFSGHVCPIDIEPSDDYFSLTDKVEKQTGINCNQQRILYQGIRLWDYSRIIGEYNIKEGDTLIIMHRGPLELPSK